MRKYVRGDKAVGICRRCSNKMLRRDMVEDGYHPGLMVCPDCYDDRHPQERLPKLDDPVTLYKPAPDDVGTPPELEGDIIGSTATLTWDEAIPINARIDSYDLYRRVFGDATWTLVVSLPITYGIFMDITAQTLTYVDSGLTPGVTYEYFIEATTDPEGPDPLSSNRVVLAVSPNTLFTPATGGLVIAGAAPTVTVPINEDFETGIRLDAINFTKGADIPANAAYDFGTGDFTVQVYFRVDLHSGDFSRRILRMSSTGPTRRWDMKYTVSGFTDTNGFEFQLASGATLRIATCSFANVPHGTWMHYTAVVNRTSAIIEFYKDGVFVLSNSLATLAGLSVTSATQVGELIEFSSISVDDMRIWNKALSGAEIAANFAAPLPNPAGTANLVAYWKFNEGSGTNLDDSSVTANDATIDDGVFVTGPP